MKIVDTIIGGVLVAFVFILIILLGNKANLQSENGLFNQYNKSYSVKSYLVTFVNGNTIKSWNVDHGEVNLIDNNWYYFTDVNSKYIRVPAEKTIIEEVN